MEMHRSKPRGAPESRCPGVRSQPCAGAVRSVSDSFESHTDVIVAVHADAVYAIGGNASNSVSVTRYPKTDFDHLSDAGGVFALLVNNV